MASEGVMGVQTIPFGIAYQSISAFCPTNGIRDYAGMDIARQNIRHLMSLRGLSGPDLQAASGVGQSWISRWLNAGIRKTDPERLAAIAKVFGVTVADLMFTDLTTLDRLPSQPTQLEQQILDAAVKLVQDLEAYSPFPADPKTYSNRLRIAMIVAQEEGAEGILDGSKTETALRRFAAQLRQAG